MPAEHPAEGRAGLHVEVRDGVEHWCIRNPGRRNAVHPDALRELTRRCADARGAVVVLRGSDDGPFCSGFDLGALAEALQTDADAPDAVLSAATEAMRRADATFVAAVSRYAIGAGVELLAACDLRVADDDAFVLVPAGKLGVVYHAAGVARMRASFGATATRALLLSGRRIRAADPVLRPAFVALTRQDAVVDEAHALARDVAALDANSRRHHVALLRALDQGPPTVDQLEAHERARAAAYEAVRAGPPPDPKRS